MKQLFFFLILFTFSSVSHGMQPDGDYGFHYTVSFPETQANGYHVEFTITGLREDTPFGTLGEEGDRSISYYQKGSVTGLFVDFQIRNETRNEHSLDDVMRHLYREYYQKKQRGFTEAEFEQPWESLAGVPLASLFEFLYTAKDMDYQKCLGFAGLETNHSKTTPERSGEVSLTTLSCKEAPEALQLDILKSWQGD